MKIPVFQRQAKSFIEEKVYGEAWISFFYGNPICRWILSHSILQKWVSRVYGCLQKLPHSQKKIEPFVKKFSIQMDRFVVPDGGFRSFDEFFIRALRPGTQAFPSEAKRMGSPCEARLSVFPIQQEKATLVVKGVPVDLASLVGSLVNLLKYSGGYVWVFRLCPVDYHRFHFFDDGKILLQKRLNGKLHSVNPLSLEKIDGVFLENERNVSVLKTENFSEVVFLEVGALCVGEIEQFKRNGAEFRRSEEKGCFHFGGSTVILLTQSGVSPDPDLMETTHKGFESLVGVGEAIGSAT